MNGYSPDTPSNTPPKSGPKLERAGDYAILGLRDDSDDALIEAWAQMHQAEQAITDDSNIEASWSAIEPLIEIIDET